jgi:hypothetical protein
VTEQESGDVIVRAENVSEPAVRLSSQDLTSLLDHHVRYSHMDMEPRDILLRKDSAAMSSDKCKLVAILDREMAGFYPDGLEDMQKTAGFGSTSVMWDWYDTYMNFCTIQPFRGPTVICLMEAVCLIRTSTEQQFKGVNKRFWDAYLKSSNSNTIQSRWEWSEGQEPRA